MLERSRDPLLFGRVTAVLGEHAKLHELVHRLRDLAIALRQQGAGEGPRARQVLDELIPTMKAHFQAEEAEAYFGTLRASVPSLNEPIDALCAEHQGFVQRAHELRERLQGEPDAVELGLELGDFVERFLAHERVEGRIIREFLGADLE